jgi:hypothetical protein
MWVVCTCSGPTGTQYDHWPKYSVNVVLWMIEPYRVYEADGPSARKAAMQPKLKFRTNPSPLAKKTGNLVRSKEPRIRDREYSFGYVYRSLLESRPVGKGLDSSSAEICHTRQGTITR